MSSGCSRRAAKPPSGVRVPGGVGSRPACGGTRQVTTRQEAQTSSPWAMSATTTAAMDGPAARPPITPGV